MQFNNIILTNDLKKLHETNDRPIDWPGTATQVVRRECLVRGRTQPPPLPLARRRRSGGDQSRVRDM